MTEIQLPAGREMDALVAEKVMGWHGPVVWIEDDYGRDPYLFSPDADPEKIATNDRGWDCLVPAYSVVIDDALDVWKRMRLTSVGRPLLLGEYKNPSEAPLAICRAALTAVGLLEIHRVAGNE